MLTVGEVSKMLGVSPQAIYLKINDSMKDELATHVKEMPRGKRTIKMIEPEGVEIIAASLEQVIDEQLTSVDKSLIDMLQENMIILQEQLLAKDRQLDVKDLQIKELNQFLREQQDMNKNSQVLLHRQQDVKALEDGKSWWSRFKSSFK